LFTASEIVSERGIYLENDNDNNNNNQGGTAYIEFVSEVDLEKALFYHDEHYGKYSSLFNEKSIDAYRRVF
jgi:hypothetical protein